MQKGLWSPAWRLLTIGVGLLLVHSVWAYVEARRLEGAIRSIETRAVPGGRHPRESRLDDAARFYEAAWVLSPGIELRGAVRDDDPLGPREIEWLRALGPSLEMLDRGATVPACRFIWKDELPNLRSMRDVAKAGSLRTRDRLRAGDVEGAAASTLSSLRHLRVFTPEAPLIGHLMRGALLDVALGDVHRVVEESAPGPARTALQEAVDAQIVANEIEDALTAERAWLVRAIGRSLNDGLGIPYGRNWLLRPAVRHFAVSVLDHMSRAVAASRHPWPDRVRLLVDMREPGWPAGQAVPSIKRATRTLARLTALTHAMSTCLGIERHRERHGMLPETLPEPAHVDPFTGQALKYRREQDGYVVYSVGENGIDDGGAVEAGSVPGQWKDYGYRIRTAGSSPRAAPAAPGR